MTIPLKGNFLLHTHPKNLIDARVIYTGDYEPDVKDVFKAIIKKGDVVLDIGANVGFHTLYFAELVGDGGSVIAFEPIAQNFKMLQANVALNGYAQIQTKQLALGDKNEQINIHIDPNNSNPGSFNLFSQTDTNTQINCRRGDEVVEEIGLEKVNMMKIDVEGYEQYVFKGLWETIKKHQPKIVFEFDRNYQSKNEKTPFNIFDFLSPLGYRFFVIQDKGLMAFSFDMNLLSAEILALPEKLFLPLSEKRIQN